MPTNKVLTGFPSAEVEGTLNFPVKPGQTRSIPVIVAIFLLGTLVARQGQRECTGQIDDHHRNHAEDWARGQARGKCHQNAIALPAKPRV